MARRGVKMGLGDFLGDSAATYIPEAALPTAPRVRAEGEEDGGRGGYRRGGDRGYDREPSRSESSDQWRGDRGGYSDRGGDRFGDRRGDDRYGSRSGGDDNWRGSAGGPSRYDRPSRDAYAAEERPAHMRLNLQRRGESGDVRNAPASSSEDKFAGAFARRFGSAGGDDRRGGGDRYGDDRRGGDRYGDDRRGGDRFGGDRRGGYGDRYGDDRRDDRFSGGRFGRGDDRESSLSSGFNSLRVNDEPPAQQTSAPANEELDKKARAQKLREERKKKAEEERLAAEEAKRKAAEEKKAAEEAFAQRAAQDKAVIDEVLASGKLGDELVKVAKDVFAKAGRVPTGAVVIEAVTKKAENVAKASANWIAPTQYGPLLKLALADAPTNEQVKALYALQVFLNGHDFPKGVLEKCFMALYTLDILEEKAFFDYKYDVDSDVPGRMKAIVQTSTWLTWLETPEEESEEEDE